MTSGPDLARAPWELGSLGFHLIHYGVLVGVPALTAFVLWVTGRRSGATNVGTREDRLSRYRQALGQPVPVLIPARPIRPVETKRRGPAVRVATVHRERSDPRVLAGAAFSAGAGLAHVGATPDHVREFWLFGVFFVTAAAAQITWAGLVLRRPSRVLFRAGLVGNGGIILLWAVTRTVGLPFGPARWTPETIGLPDLTATLCEAAIVAVCLWLLWPSRSRWDNGVGPATAPPPPHEGRTSPTGPAPIPRGLARTPEASPRLHGA